MAYEQIYNMVNASTREALGASALTVKDTSTLAEVGGQILTDESGLTLETFMNGLSGAIKNTRIKAKSYKGFSNVSAYRTMDEFGLYYRKVQRNNIRDVRENSSYKTQNWNYYNTDLVKNWTDRLFGKINGFETEPEVVSRVQLKKCFSDPEEMAAFINMLDIGRLNDIRAHMETCEVLARGTAIASCYGNSNTMVDLGAIYNRVTGKATTPDSWLYDADLVRFIVVEMKRIIERMKPMNRLFNNAGADRFTEKNDLIVDIHSDLIASMNGYLESTLIAPFVDAPEHNEVTRWQASGTTVSDLSDSYSIEIVNENVNSGNTVNVDGIVAFAHDYEKYALTIDDMRTVTARNELQEMITTVTKYDVAYAIDPSEQGVVFYIGTHNAA